MKLIQLLLALVTLSHAWSAQADEAPIRVGVTFSHAYIPTGFDTNDVVQFVGEGLFRNLCYRHAQPSVRVDHRRKIIFVGPVAYKYDGFCLQVVLPFERVVDVGILQAGRYTVLQTEDGKRLGEVVIEPAQGSGPDDYLYAPISQAYVHGRGAATQVILSGTFPAACMRLKETITAVQNDVLLVQPIVEIDRQLPCTPGKFPFEVRVVPSPLKTGRYLLHVRSMNGKAVNTLFDIP